MSELKKIKDKFFFDVLHTLTEDKHKTRLYLIYRVCNALTTWGTIIIAATVTILTGVNVVGMFG